MERTRRGEVSDVVELGRTAIDNIVGPIDGSVEFVEKPGKTPVVLSSCCNGKSKEKDVQDKPYKIKHVYQKAGVYYSLQCKIKRTDNVDVDLKLAVSYKYKPKNRSQVTGSISLAAFGREINFRPYQGTRCLVSFALNTTAYYKEVGQLGYSSIALDPISC